MEPTPHGQALNVVFFGTPDFAVPSLLALHNDKRFAITAVVSQPDRPAGRGKKPQAAPVKQAAIRLDLPVLEPPFIRKKPQEFLALCNRFGPIDFFVVIAFGQILPEPVLTFPRFGAINVHASLLPRWRGAAPIHRAILAGDTRSGVCIMEMESGLDTGPVYASEEVSISPLETAGDLHDRLSTLSTELLPDTLVQIAKGSLKPTPQQEIGVTYAKKIEAEEAHIDWNRPTTEVLHQIHGMSPFPGAFSFLDGQRIKVFRVAPAEKTNELPAGSLTRSSKELLVNTHDGALSVLELQPAGKRRMAVKEFLAGVRGGDEGIGSLQ